MAASILFQAEYRLTRWQYFRQHLHVWGPLVLLPGIPVVLGFAAATHPSIFAVGAFLLSPVVLLFLFPGVVRGWLFIVFGSPPVAVQIQENSRFPGAPAMGIGAPGREPDWWFFLDSVIGVERSARDLWTIQQYAGGVLSIPADLMTEEVLALIRSQMDFSRTPEGIQRIVERGRAVEAAEGGKG